MIILIAMLFFTSAQLAGSAQVVVTSWGVLDRTTAIVVIGLVFIIFTALGGMESVAWTDTFCTVVILAGIWMLMFRAVGAAGGVGEIHRTLAKIKPTALDPFAGGGITVGVAISWILTWGIGNFGAPQFSTRIYSARDPRRRRRAWDTRR